MAANFELATFINEFMRLNSSGINSKLELQSYYGKVYVNINAELGFVSPTPTSVSPLASSAKCYKPSRVRRRKRRAAKEHAHGQQYEEPFSSNIAYESSSDTAANDLIEDDENDLAKEVENENVCKNKIQDVCGFMPEPLLPCPVPIPQCQAVNTQTSDFIKKDEGTLAPTKLDMMMINIMKDLNARR